MVSPPSASSGRALRQAQGRLFGELGASGGDAKPAVLKRVCRDIPRGGRAEVEVDRCSLLAANVSSFRVNVFTFRPDVSTFRANVSSLRPNVFSRG